jgi:hypothetical protein
MTDMNNGQTINGCDPLRNIRHERFCLALAEGMSATAAYQQAGYKQTRSCTANAARLITNDDVKARLAHLQTTAAKKAEVSIESLLSELEHARQRADSLDQLSAVVKSISEKARISGLLVQRVEVGGPGDFDDCETVEAIVDRMLTGPGSPCEQFYPVDAEDRQGLLDLIERHRIELEDYIEAIKTRPRVVVRCNPADLTTPWKELELRPVVDDPAQRRWDEIKRQRELQARNQRLLSHRSGRALDNEGPR